MRESEGEIEWGEKVREIEWEWKREIEWEEKESEREVERERERSSCNVYFIVKYRLMIMTICIHKKDIFKNASRKSWKYYLADN